MFRKILVLIFTLLCAFSLSACAKKEPPKVDPKPVVVNETAAEKLMNEATGLVKSQAEPEMLLPIIEQNIKTVGEKNAEILLMHLETLQEIHSAEYSELYCIDKIQENLKSNKVNPNDLDALKKTKDDSLIALTEKLIKSGYMFKQEGGDWCPAIDYGYYMQFKDSVSKEMQDYLTIMEVESKKPYIKDMGLEVDQKELGERMVAAEKYLVAYPTSARVEKVKNMFAGYMYNYMIGIDNTPIFNPETLKVNQSVLSAYDSYIKENSDLESSKAVKAWKKALEENNNEFSEETMAASFDKIKSDLFKKYNIEEDYK